MGQFIGFGNGVGFCRDFRRRFQFVRFGIGTCCVRSGQAGFIELQIAAVIDADTDDDAALEISIHVMVIINPAVCSLIFGSTARLAIGSRQVFLGHAKVDAANGFVTVGVEGTA